MDKCETNESEKLDSDNSAYLTNNESDGAVCPLQETPTKSDGTNIEEDEDIEDEFGNDDEITEQDDETSSQTLKSALTAQQRARHALTGRGVTLSMLMQDHIIEPGENNMSIDYLGQKFTADLLADGQIKWREEDKIFGSPSAWALHCKKIVNPSKKSGCGWASVRYKGKKLDVYKSSWVRKQKPAVSSLATHSSDGFREDLEDGETEEESDCKKLKLDTEEDTSDNDCEIVSLTSILQEGRRLSVRHCSLGRKCNAHDQTTMVECHTFNQLGRMQPFNIRMKTNALLMMDFHCHLTSSEVVGYLGGSWDNNSQYLLVEQAFPCKSRLADKENAVNIENQIRCDMEKKGISLVGWYHSHPKSQPDPSLRDIESQMEYQLLLRGPGSTYHPCVGVIVAPYDAYSSSKESQLKAYWVMPPPEQRPLDYGVPMSLQYEVEQNDEITDDLTTEIKQLVEFYSGEPDLIDLKLQWSHSLTHLDKFRMSLKKKLPKQSEGLLENILNAVCPKTITNKTAPQT